MVFVVTFVTFLILLIVTKYYRCRIYQRVAFLAFSGHLLISLVLIPRLPYMWDIAKFHRTASEIATGTSASGSTTVSSFGAFQGLIYALFSPQPEILAIFNGLLAVLMAIPASYLTSSLYSTSSRNTYGVMLAILFLPLPFLFLSIPMRDALTVFLFFTLLAVTLHVLQTKTLFWGLPGIPLWGMLYLLRPELALILVLGVVAGNIVRGLRIVSSELSLSSLTFVFGTVGFLGFGLFAKLLYSFERVNAALKYRSKGGAVYLNGMEYSSWFDFLLAAPARGIYFQFAPFPLHVDSMFHLLAFLSTLIIIVLFVSAARSLYKCDYNETAGVMLVVVYLAGIVGYGTINSNFGTNVRHRIVFDFLLIVLAGPVLQQWWLRAHEWIGVVPSQCNDDDEQKCETQEFDRCVHAGGQHTSETQ